MVFSLSMGSRWAESHNQFQTAAVLLFFVPFLPPLLHGSINGVDFILIEDYTSLYRDSLLLFKFWLRDPHQFLSTWTFSYEPCRNWRGVSCSSHGFDEVTSINLTDMELQGRIHPSICNIVSIKHIYFFNNCFQGPIPDCFGKLWKLETLDLGENCMSGSVPSSIAGLVNLRELVLAGNVGFNGVLPFWIGNFSDNLRRIDLSSCSFEGDLPESLYGSSSTRYLNLGHNYFSGNLREFYQPLVFLNLYSNSFSGTLPCFNASAESLIYLDLASNLFVGGIPTCFRSFNYLENLNLSFNELNYSISPILEFSESLISIDLSFNRFSGAIPDEIVQGSSKSNLVFLDLSHNRFTGNIPSKFTEIQTLQALFLSHNLLSGVIPTSIGSLTYLQVIDISHNLLSGSIPVNIVGCFQLLALLLNNNKISGGIQPEFNAMDSLKVFDISNNMISGDIPITLAGCKSLEVVNLSFNNFSGTLTDSISKWENLRFLSLTGNKFSGVIPCWIFDFPSIKAIDLSANKFTGQIPDCRSNTSLNIAADELHPTSQITPFQMRISVIVDSSSNNLEFRYQISSSISVDFSRNMLQGEFPSSLFELRGLECLNMSYNQINGMIPAGLEKMKILKSFDISHNSISGPVPESITDLTDLLVLDLRYNQLSGSIPETAGYWMFPGALDGNPGLCTESDDANCQREAVAGMIDESIEDEMENNGPISVALFSVSTVVSFYIGIMCIFCSSRARNYIMYKEEKPVFC